MSRARPVREDRPKHEPRIGGGHKHGGERPHESEVLETSLLRNSLDVTTVLVADGTISYISPAIERLMGYTRAELVGKKVQGYIYPQDLARVSKWFEANLRGAGDTEPLEFQMRHADGSWRCLEAVGNNLLDEPGVGGMVVNLRDVTGRKLVEKRLREAEERYRHLVENVPVVIYEQWPVEGKVATYSTTYMSPRIEDILGYSSRWFTERSDFWDGLIHAEDLERVRTEDERTDITGEPYSVEYRMLARDGRVVWVRDEAVLIRDDQGGPLYWQGVMSDVSERKRLEGELSHWAFHDTLTGLPNRRLWSDRLKQAQVRSEQRKTMTAVLFMDVDGLKVVNDSLGHEAGDELLVAVARRLEACLRPEDTLARFGGDEFVLVLDDIRTPSDAVRVARRVEGELRNPILLRGKRIFVGVSTGIALGTGHASLPTDLLRQADTAMYRAKQKGASHLLFEPDMRERTVEHLGQH